MCFAALPAPLTGTATGRVAPRNAVVIGGLEQAEAEVGDDRPLCWSAASQRLPLRSTGEQSDAVKELGPRQQYQQRETTRNSNISKHFEIT